jgi:transcriptional regulator with XRE-family HTH domain
MINSARMRRENAARTQAHIVELGRLLKERRTRLGLSLRAAETETGVSYGVLAHLEHGAQPDLANTLAVMIWLSLPLGWFSTDHAAETGSYQRGWDDCAELVRAVLLETQ